MGYMGLDAVTDSDMAADLVHGLADAIKSKLVKGMKEDAGNEYNTEGIVNVALFLEEIRGTYLFYALDEFVMQKFIPKFEKFISDYTKGFKKAKKEDYLEHDDDINYQWHLKSYKRMLRNIQNSLD